MKLASMSVDQWIPVSAECKTWYCNKSSNVWLPKEFCPDDICFLFLTPLPSAAQSSLLWSWLQNQTATTDFQTGTLRSLSNGPCSHQQWSILKLRSLSNGPQSLTVVRHIQASRTKLGWTTRMGSSSLTRVSWPCFFGDCSPTCLSSISTLSWWHTIT